MGDMLSQAEIDALLKGSAISDVSGGTASESGEELTPQEKDALGEIGNISMGTSATTLFTLLGQKVLITTPKVTVSSWDELSKEYTLPLVAVRVEYKHGLIGSNLLILKEDDVKIITDLMMGGEGLNAVGELTDLHLSAISEAMNQMVGSSATSMSSMFNKRIDISPPKAFVMRFEEGRTHMDFEGDQSVVKIAFKMVVGNLIDSEIMQIIPINFARELVRNLLNIDMGSPYEVPQPSKPAQQIPQQPQQRPPETPVRPQSSYQMEEPPVNQNIYYSESPNRYEEEQWQTHGGQQRHRGPVNVQPAQFEPFDNDKILVERKNISLIMDVPLQVTVELGRTNKMIKDILEFGPGSIIELDKLAGEPVDILVNGKQIAKGEVVVIDESFGVRITDIIHPSKRL